MENLSKVKKFLSENFNLSENEIALYMELLKNGSSTVLELSTRTKINRSTVHMNIEYLTKKELITQIAKGRGSRRLIVPEPVEKIYLMIQQKKTKLEIAEKQFPEIVEELSSLKKPNKDKSELDIRYYKGKSEVALIYDEILKSKEIRAYVNCEEVSKIFPNNIIKFIETHIKRKDINTREIMQDSPKSREYAKKMPKDKYCCKFTAKQMNLSTIDYMIFDNKVAVIDLEKGINAVMIFNRIAKISGACTRDG